MAKFCLTLTKSFSLVNGAVKLFANLIHLQSQILTDIEIFHVS